MSRSWLLAVAVLAFAGTAQGDDDPLQVPARQSSLAPARAITALTRTVEGRLIAVGPRGHILRSSDGGKHWEQAKVPLSSDLTAVQFVDANTGYAVGHDGVVLKSVDGGASWTKLLDGREANRLTLEQLQRQGDERLLAEARHNVELGPDKPFFDLWFENASEGFVIGAYNLIFKTSDGGRSWQSWFDRTDNPKLLNLYALRPAPGGLYIAGEGGLLLKLDPRSGRFKALASPYDGSFFGLVGSSSGLIAFGMRGHAYLSRDEGRSWSPMQTGLSASITAGNAAPDGRVALVDQAGRLALSRDGGESFTTAGVQPPMPLAAVALTRSGVVVGGLRGAHAVGPGKDK
jgi:photosystem II stability/assembly factor-like uncharacterized protein